MPENRDRLYPGGSPVVVIQADSLTTRLIPIGDAPILDVTNLQFDLGLMLRKICDRAGSEINTLLGPAHKQV